MSGKRKQPRYVIDPLEEEEQKDVVKYLDRLLPAYPAIHPLFFVTLNGAKLQGGGKAMNKIKPQGFVAGVHDLIFLHGRGGFFYMTLEMKQKTDYKISENQLEFQAAAKKNGGYSIFGRGFGEAKEHIDHYVSMPTTQELLIRAVCELERKNYDKALKILHGITNQW